MYNNVGSGQQNLKQQRKEMRAVIQRSGPADLRINGEIYSHIDGGLFVLLGIGRDDTTQDVEYVARKIAGLRIFEDENGKMNNNVFSTTGQIMVVSQFTLYGELGSGYRPGFSSAMMPEGAEKLYDTFIDECKKYNYNHIATGVFGEDMKITFTNDGPTTIIIDTEKRGK